MADRICLEKAFADEAGLTDIVTAAGNDRIVFPHVDSCVAIIFRMADGTVMGGHATMQIRGDAAGYGVSATDMLTRIQAQASGAAIAQVLYVGHPDPGTSISPWPGRNRGYRRDSGQQHVPVGRP